MKIYPYKAGSKSAKALAEALGIKRLKREGGAVNDVVINWGCSEIHRVVNDAIFNRPQAVKKASNKLTTLRILDDTPGSIPEWTTSPEEAREWYNNDDIVVARTKLTGHSGEGIILSCDVNGEDEWDKIQAPLYTKYIPKGEEYRIHVFKGETFFVQRKARKMDVPKDQVNWKVRNLAGGFIFANKDVDVPDVANQEAIWAVDALGLDFGAVDIILGKNGLWYVLEVNTACGLEGTTLEKYCEQFRKYL